MGGVKRAGVLALQGDFEAHRKALERAGAAAVEVRTAAELDGVDGLIIPGGESTTMLRIIKDEALLEPLARFGRERPIFGTCAGAILLATEVSNPAQESLGLVDMAIERNAYGRQLDSRVVRLMPEEEFLQRTGPGDLETVFIRAPIIRRIGSGARVYLFYNGDPVLVAQGRHLVATFHPELTADLRIHRLFVEGL
ncbi:MAG: pyridoxal 5'-phosphate synthase glutaminase subunit PdxT [Bryobacteraceae bacterium]